MAKITTENLLHTADQARLILSEDKLENYLKELNDILAFTEKLNEVDTEGVTATSYGNHVTNVLREDVPKKWDKREAALDNAPEQDEGHFKVPAIMD